MQDQEIDYDAAQRLHTWLRNQPDIEGLPEGYQPRNLPEALTVYEASQDLTAAYMAGAGRTNQDLRRKYEDALKELAAVRAERDRAQEACSQIADRLTAMNDRCRTIIDTDTKEG